MSLEVSFGVVFAQGAECTVVFVDSEGQLLPVLSDSLGFAVLPTPNVPTLGMILLHLK